MLYMYFVSPYFDHDAFMHHTMHVLGAPVCMHVCVYNCVRVYTSLGLCVYVCMYCMYTCIDIQSFRWTSLPLPLSCEFYILPCIARSLTLSCSSSACVYFWLTGWRFLCRILSFSSHSICICEYVSCLEADSLNPPQWLSAALLLCLLLFSVVPLCIVSSACDCLSQSSFLPLGVSLSPSV